MVAELQQSADEMTRALVIERVQAYVEDGKQPTEAFSLVWEEIEQSGDVEALARLHGVNLVGTIWRSWNIAHRPAAVARTIARPVHPVTVTGHEGVHGEVLPPAPIAARRIDLALVRETLDSQYIVDGQWVRLADMTATQCLKVADDYRGRAIADEHKSRHMRAIAAGLKEGETVGQKFTEREVMRLYQICMPPGNTLA
jgi:hypothetical protein